MWKKCHHFWCWRYRLYQIEGRWYCLKHGRPLIEAMERRRVYGGRIYVEPHLSVVDLETRQYPDGTVLRCVYCRKTFVQNNQHCALGYCQECS